MLLDRLARACVEELQKAVRVAAVAYAWVRAADEQALQTLWMFFQDR